MDCLLTFGDPPGFCCIRREIGQYACRHGACPSDHTLQSRSFGRRQPLYFWIARHRPQTHTLPGDLGQEVTNCLENVGRVLKDAHMDYSDVASVQIYLTDMSRFDQVNSIYGNYFKSPFPSRTTVQVTKLSLGARIEIAAIAHK